MRRYCRCKNWQQSRTVVWPGVAVGWTEPLNLEQSSCRIQHQRVFVLVTALNACSSLRDLESGRMIHAQCGMESRNIYVASTAVSMYAKCGDLVEARNVFDRMPWHNAVSWNALMLGYAENKRGEEALDLFSRMGAESCCPDSRSFVAAIKACSSLAAQEEGSQVDGKVVKLHSLERGIAIHSQAASCGCESDLFVANTLISMYAKCGSLIDARRIFDRMACHSLVSWNALILGYADNEEAELALEIFTWMNREGVWAPDSQSFTAAFKAVAALAAKEEGRNCEQGLIKVESLRKGAALHAQAAAAGVHLELGAANTLLDMYAKCGSLSDAFQVFDKLQDRDAVSWTALMLGCAENGQAEFSLELFSSMKGRGCLPDARTFVAALKACAVLAMKEESKEIDGQFLKVESLERGMLIHAEAANRGCELDIFVANTLVDMYAKCGSMVDAHRVFDKMVCHTVVSWTILMLGYVEIGEGELALELFTRMQREGHQANAGALFAAVRACTSLGVSEIGTELQGSQQLLKLKSLERGMGIHAEAVKTGCGSSNLVANALIDMYAKCGSLRDAWSVFEKMEQRDVVSWTALMMGYVESGDESAALQLFQRMMLEENCVLDARSFVAALKACIKVAAKEAGELINGKLVKVGALEQGMVIHSQVVKQECDSDIFVGRTLMEMYVKCGSLLEARRVFDQILSQDAAAITCLMLGYLENGEAELVLELFFHLQHEGGGPAPDSQIFLAALKAAGALARLEFGRAIHGDICRTGLDRDPMLNNCLVDIYGRFGSMVEAQLVFDSLLKPDSVAWTSLIAGYSRQGVTSKVFRFFEEMLETGIRADRITFNCVLAACSHAGLVEKGKACFRSMQFNFGIVPDVEHYTCMVDLLSRANQLEDAVEVLENKTASESDWVAWMAVLAACRKWKNVVIGRMAFEKVLKVREQNLAAYMLMEQIYGSLGVWEKQRSLEVTRRNHEQRKTKRIKASSYFNR